MPNATSLSRTKGLRIPAHLYLSILHITRNGCNLIIAYYTDRSKEHFTRAVDYAPGVLTGSPADVIQTECVSFLKKDKIEQSLIVLQYIFQQPRGIKREVIYRQKNSFLPEIIFSASKYFSFIKQILFSSIQYGVR